MNDSFDLPVTYEGKGLLFLAKLLLLGYTCKFAVDVNGTKVLYEPDEERNYRAIVEPIKLEDRKIDVGLLKAIAGAIELIVK